MSISFDRAVEYYDSTRGYPPEIAEAIGSALIGATDATPQTRFLEVGVGTGRIALPIIARGHDYTGVDISAAMMSRLRAKLVDLERETGRPPRVRLLTQFTTIPDGMKFLVDLRATLLDLTRGDPHLAALESDLRTLLASWFDVGFLELQRIDWNSPAVLLERLVGYEAVHEIRSWSDLKNRLDSDRRCYALFHHRMPNEPLIFVEVALVDRISEGITPLLDEAAAAVHQHQHQ